MGEARGSLFVCADSSISVQYCRRFGSGSGGIASNSPSPSRVPRRNWANPNQLASLFFSGESNSFALICERPQPPSPPTLVSLIPLDLSAS